MFSDISRHQHPHNFAFPFLHSPENQQPCRDDSEGLVDTFQHRAGQEIPNFDTGLRRSFQKHRQHAKLMKNEAHSSICTPKAVSQPLRIDSSEHMLRRKTPNGTLSAGYDGTPVEWASTPHTSKHFLVPSSETGSQNAYQSSRNGAPLFPRQVVLNRTDDGRHHQMWSQATASPLNRYAFGNSFDGVPSKPLWVPNGAFPPSLDSMLYQAPTPHHFYNTGAVQQVPALLQPAWPPTDGPTVSNAHGPYGPYWPDGSHEPYRPAALRDGRFNSQFANISLNSPPESQNSADGPNWFDTRSQYIGPIHADFMTQSTRPSRDFDNMREGQIAPQIYDSGYQNEQILLSHRGRPVCTKYQPPQIEPHGWPAPLSTPPTYFIGNAPPANNLQFKGKVLIWAHRIYMNLLKTIHENRKQNQHKQFPGKIPNQTNIFPRAPRRSLSSPRIPGHCLDSRPKVTTANSENNVRGPDNPNAGLHGRIDSDTGNFQWVAANPGNYQDQLDRDVRFINPLHGNQSPQLPDFRISSDLPPSSSLNAHIVAQNQQPRAPYIEAQAALDMLARLCQESGWQWVDGLLLGGCLAYGLQDYRTALEWYQRVLSSDQE